ncbi:MAG TPA: hypothetical protein VEH57_00665 [Thermoplasmata archaeon]|nr:hypothetical protein [Thermoplasmata archaeon]
MGTYEAERANGERPVTQSNGGPREDAWPAHLRLGQEVRVVLAAVGGGAIRIGAEIARRHIRHLETVAINCDPKVQSYEEFDRRVYLGPDTGTEGDTGGSPVVGGTLAGAAEPALERIFRGATFVILVGSLGGGAGSGALPYILEVASRNAEVVSVFVVKPFRCEGDRRALADRAIGRLHLISAFVEKRERGRATFQTLDNESLVATQAHLAFSRVTAHWAHVIETHIQRSYLDPAEAMIEAAHAAEISMLAEATVTEPPAVFAPPESPLPAPPVPLPPLVPAAPATGAEVELTFEVVPEARSPSAS